MPTRSLSRDPARRLEEPGFCGHHLIGQCIGCGVALYDTDDQTIVTTDNKLVCSDECHDRYRRQHPYVFAEVVAAAEARIRSFGRGA
jgi:hypothetical protein